MQDYGVILLPEGLIEYQPQSHDFGVFPTKCWMNHWLCWQRFIPEFNSLISEINDKLAQPELQPTEEAKLVKLHQWNQSLVWKFVFPTFAWHSAIWIAFLRKSIVTAGATGHSECSLQGKCGLLQVSKICLVSKPPMNKSSTRLVSQLQTSVISKHWLLVSQSYLSYSFIMMWGIYLVLSVRSFCLTETHMAMCRLGGRVQTYKMILNCWISSWRKCLIHDDL